jgi:DNA-binding response OmpR family regulator
MKKILLIDDDDLSRMLLKEHLLQSGFAVVEAEDGEMGKELFNSNRIDVVITDIFMPFKEGIATIAEILEVAPEAKIIAISDGGSVVKSFDYLEHAKEMGALAAFQKPVNTSDLISIIEAL